MTKIEEQKSAQHIFVKLLQLNSESNLKSILNCLNDFYFTK